MPTQKQSRFWTSVFALSFALFLMNGLSAAILPSALAFFDAKIRPVLEEHCFDCHGREKQKNKLRPDNTLGVVSGG